MNCNQILTLVPGVLINIVTNSAVFPIATGEITEQSMKSNIIAIKLTAPYDAIPAGAVAFFNTNQIIAIS
ncbi:MAG: hypothetical protein AB2417_00185 [Clostridiaceae bacterium]